MRHTRLIRWMRGIGPGGLNCPCCAPPPGKRKELFRNAKKRERAAAMKIEFDALDAERT